MTTLEHHIRMTHSQSCFIYILFDNGWHQTTTFWHNMTVRQLPICVTDHQNTDDVKDCVLCKFILWKAKNSFITHYSYCHTI